MFIKPEDLARQHIDRLLQAAGWIIQNYEDMQRSAGRGIAVREFPLKTGFADYMLFVDRQAVGVVEAKKEGAPLTGYEAQAKRYSEGLPDNLPALVRPLPFLYQSTNKDIRFTSGFDPKPRSRRVFAFHRPETLAAWLTEGTQSLRWRLANRYQPLQHGNLWRAQIEAINNLESSLGQGKERALIQMATGSGKTYTAVNYVYRMLRDANVKRVLFLVDRSNLAKQTLAEFQNFDTPDDGRKFTEIYNVQRLTSNKLDDVSKVVITTIQRLYSMLRGEDELDEAVEEVGLFEQEATDPKFVSYNPRIPIEYFDVIITDECHRSIYNLWRQVLEYFDAFLIGMTATPSKQTFGFFQRNLVMEYTREQAVIDRVNVPGEVYVIRTRITQQGSAIEAGEVVPRRDRKTRSERMALMDEDFIYAPTQLDLQVVAPDQIRTIIRTFRDRLFTEIFPDRDGTHVPKTLIFAKDDSHAEEIVQVVRHEFNQGNDFCEKITYRVDRPEEAINRFRNSYNPRIAVTVDMIATGTDVKAIEVLMFMRVVKSAGLYEQMQGRGVRVINDEDMKLATPDAGTKEKFIIVDTVGIIDLPKAETVTMERLPSMGFDKLLDNLAAGDSTDDLFITLAQRLSRLERKLIEPDRQAIEKASGGLSLVDLAHRLYDATDADRQTEYAAHIGQSVEQAALLMKQDAADLFVPALRRLIIAIHARDEIIVDDVSLDEVMLAGYDGDATERARGVVQTFRDFIDQHRDEIAALQILYGIPYADGRLQWAHITELAARLKQQSPYLTPETLWRAFALVEPERVHMRQTKRVLTDLVTLVRHAIQPEGALIPYAEQVNGRYADWLQTQSDAGRQFSPQQRQYLDAIAGHIGLNLSMELRDFDDGHFHGWGGVYAAVREFGDADTLRALLDELNRTLAA